MRIAVTGATGFLGGHLVDRLLGDGHSVIAFARRPDAAAMLAKKGAEIVLGDLTAAIELPKQSRAEVFIHAAALSSNWGPRAAFLAANVGGTRRALELARAMGVRRFVHISSPSIYFRFADQLGVREDAPLPRPVNAYAESKGLAEALVLAARDLNPLILRPRGIYGRGDVTLLPRLIRTAARGPLPLLRGGQAVTDLTHVDDAVSAVLAALDAPVSVGALAVNISGGEALPIVKIVEGACGRVGVRPHWRRMPFGLALAGSRVAETIAAVLPGRPEPIVTMYSLGVLAYSQTLDISRAAAVLGWRPQIEFEAGRAML